MSACKCGVDMENHGWGDPPHMPVPQGEEDE